MSNLSSTCPNWLSVDSPSINYDGLSHVFGEVFWLEFLNTPHSVMMMQQSAFLGHSIADGAYLILSPKIDLALEIATGS